MKLYIPTRGRPDEQPAYEQLDAAGLKPILVVDKDEYEKNNQYVGKTCLVFPGGGIAAKRQFIVDHAGDSKFGMIDDDMEIHAVDETLTVSPQGATPKTKCVISLPDTERILSEFGYVEALLEEFAHGGVHTRHFVNYAKKPYTVDVGYYRQVMFFNPKLMPLKPSYVGNTAEDVRFMLALLRQGLSYFIMTSCCMVERKAKSLPTHFTQSGKDKDMVELAKEFPKFVRVTKDGRVTLSYAAILKAAKKGTL